MRSRGFTPIELLGAIAIDSGVTSALPPNTKVIVTGPGINPLEPFTSDENRRGPAFAESIADSDHPGGVNCLLGDGSVKFDGKNTVAGPAWRALGTIAGGEVISADALLSRFVPPGFSPTSDSHLAREMTHVFPLLSPSRFDRDRRASVWSPGLA